MPLRYTIFQYNDTAASKERATKVCSSLHLRNHNKPSEAKSYTRPLQRKQRDTLSAL